MKTPEISTQAGPPALAGGPIYLDYNATTPVDPRVVDTISAALADEFGNPSSSYRYGATARTALERSRDQLSGLLNAPAQGRIVFTGSGSEANTLALYGVLRAHHPEGCRTGRRPHLITQATEHPAVLAAARQLHERGEARVTVLPVDSVGLIDLNQLAQAISVDTVLVSIMGANNETGVLQPLEQIVRIAHERGVLVHTDAAQVAGKLPIDVTALGVDLMTIAGHKMYAPKGIGALYIAPDTVIESVITGGGQEHGLRAGTENVPYAAGLGHAADLAAEALANGETERLTRLRDRLYGRLVHLLPGRTHLNGHPRCRLPNTVNLSIDGTRALSVLRHLDASNAQGVAASAGSACHSGHDQPSPVLSAMGLPTSQALEALRLSIGRWTTEDDVDMGALRLAGAVRACR